MTHFFFKFKKTIFGQFSQFSGQKKFFRKNLTLSRTTSNGFLAPCQNSKKSNNPVPRKHPKKKEERKNYFKGPF